MPLGDTMVSRSTLTNSVTTFIRDVLRQNLSDPLGTRSGSEWIYKSRPEEREIDPPIVLITCDEASYSQLTIDRDNPMIDRPRIRLDIRVWARKISHRDELADSIASILSNPSSSDGTTTIAQNQLVFKSITMRDEDGFISGFPKVLRIKRIECDFVYTGD